jgi:hypothetical protein
MGGAADGKELTQTLDDAEDDGLEGGDVRAGVHVVSPRR